MKLSKAFSTAFVILLTFFSARAQASAFTLPALDTSMTDPIFRTLASGFIFKPIEPASDLGKTWGLYVGVSGTATDSSAVSSIFNNLKTSYVPTAAVQVGVGLPKGFTLELGIVPTVSYQNTSIALYSGALKWTLTRALFPKWPLSVSISAGYSNATVNYTQPLNSGTVSVAYGSQVESAMVNASFAVGFLLGLEPYGGVGIANASSSLSGSGTANLFGSSFSSGTTSVTGSDFSTWLQAGLLLKFGFLGIAGEYDYVFGLSSWNAKVSIRI